LELTLTDSSEEMGLSWSERPYPKMDKVEAPTNSSKECDGQSPIDNSEEMDVESPTNNSKERDGCLPPITAR